MDFPLQYGISDCMWEVVVGRNPYFSGLSLAMLYWKMNKDLITSRNPYFSGLSLAIGKLMSVVNAQKLSQSLF